MILAVMTTRSEHFVARPESRIPPANGNSTTMDTASLDVAQRQDSKLPRPRDRAVAGMPKPRSARATRKVWISTASISDMS
jgi:hypothetical protein